MFERICASMTQHQTLYIKFKSSNLRGINSLSRGFLKFFLLSGTFFTQRIITYDNVLSQHALQQRGIC